MADRRRANRIIARLLVAQIVATLALFGGVLLVSYQGRVALVDSQRRGCERGKLDRAANARGWRTAQARATSQGQLGFAAVYREITRELQARSRVNCSTAFPPAQLLP